MVAAFSGGLSRPPLSAVRAAGRKSAAQYESPWSTHFKSSWVSVFDDEGWPPRAGDGSSGASRPRRAVGRPGDGPSLVRAARPLPAGQVSTFAFHFPSGWGSFHNLFAGIVAGTMPAERTARTHTGAVLRSQEAGGVGSYLEGVHPRGWEYTPVGHWPGRKSPVADLPCILRVVADLASADSVGLTFYLNDILLGGPRTLQLHPGSAQSAQWYPAADTPTRGRPVLIVCYGDW